MCRLGDMSKVSLLLPYKYKPDLPQRYRLYPTFDTYVIEDACRGINLNGSVAAAWREMRKRGVKRIQSTDIELG
jgi:hypothetical protein